MLKTLIVEDSSSSRLGICNTLYRFFPYLDLDEAFDGAEALRKAATRIPDVVFVNIAAPGLDGLELARQITSANADAIVIMLTGDDLPEYRRAAYLSGATGYIHTGTTTPADLFAIMECALSARQSSRHLH